jgi:hypothetical protein
MKWIIPLILLTAGCELQYRGISPDVRSFSEDPKLDQYYVGVNVAFCVLDPPDPNQPHKEEITTAPFFPEDPNAIPRPLPEPNIPW